MNVNTILEIYTTFTGWMFNNVVVTLLLLGFVLIPFVMMIILNFKEAITSGSFKSSVEIAVKRIESDFVEMMIVVLLMLLPYQTLDLNAIQYNAPTTNFLSVDIPAKITAANDPTTYANSINPVVSGFQVEYGNPQVPVLLYFAMKASYGANYVLTKSIIESNARNDLAAAENAIGAFGMNDPQLASELMLFNSDCYRRAYSKFVRFASDGKLEGLLTAQGATALDDNPADINHFGSVVFQTTPGLYAQCTNVDECQRTLKAMQPMTGWPYNQARDGVRLPEQEGLPGQPRCDEWWADLRPRVIDSAPAAAPVFQKIKAAFGVDFSGQDEDIIANQIIHNSFTKDQASKAVTMAGMGAGREWKLMEEIHRAITNAGLKFTLIKEGFKTEAVKNAMYILIALALMILYINIPFLLLFTGFKLKGVIIVLGMVFTLIMANTVIVLVEFMEVSIYNAVYGDKVGLFLAQRKNRPYRVCADNEDGLSTSFSYLFYNNGYSYCWGCRSRDRYF